MERSISEGFVREGNELWNWQEISMGFGGGKDLFGR